MKKFIYLILSFTLILSPLLAAGPQKVKVIDGIEVIANGKNPKPPEGIPTKIKLEAELSFGEGDDPEHSFAEVGIYTVDETGSVYALDMKDQKVMAFDDQGGLLWVINKKGQGPGELNMPSGILLTPQGELQIEDALNRRLSFFTKEGKFVKNISLADKLGLVGIVMDHKGNSIAREIGLNDDKMYFDFKVFDPELKPQSTLDRIEFKAPIPGSGNKMNLMDVMALVQFDSKGNIFYSRNLDYSIKVYDGSGKHIRTITKDFSKVKVTQEDIDDMLARIPNMAPGGVNIKDLFEFPKHFPPIQNLLLDENDMLYVRTWEKGKVKGEYKTEVFDPAGRYIAYFVSKADIRVAKNKKFYSTEENEDGFRIIKRYGVSWEK